MSQPADTPESKSIEAALRIADSVLEECAYAGLRGVYPYPNTDKPRLAQALKEVVADRNRLRDEIARVLRGDFTADEIQGFCHKLSEKVSAPCFADGCAAYQRSLYGVAPHADELAAHKQRVSEAQGELPVAPDLKRLTCAATREPQFENRLKAAMEIDAYIVTLRATSAALIADANRRVAEEREKVYAELRMQSRRVRNFSAPEQAYEAVPTIFIDEAIEKAGKV